MYSYKVVSFLSFFEDYPQWQSNLGKPINGKNQEYQVTESLINHYAADGWEYLRSEIASGRELKSSGSNMAAAFLDGLFSKTSGVTFSDASPDITVYIFRKGALSVETSNTPRYDSSWTESRDLTSNRYQIHLSKKFSIEKSELLGKFIADGNAYETFEKALSAAHEKDQLIQAEQLKVQEAKRLEDEQEAINNDTSRVGSGTHVSCMHCGSFVRKEATKCRHCGRKLTPKKA